ncbi:acid-sensing ion channel 1-like [Ambystoma mexicanum]|uniref:acid-sensing ion channel 1-like n=1 Tax=Ambystoma mexicanum TaxID=8296 RepID=UPI0037E9338C
MVWQCSQLIATFLRYPTQEKVTMVNNARLAFPAVTFCNLNRARMSKLNSSRFRFLASELPFLSRKGGDQNASTKMPEEVSIANDRQFAFALSRLTAQEQRELGHQLEDMLISCIFHGEVCDQSFFTPLLNHKLGNCYTFNGQRGSPQQPGARNAEPDILNATKAGVSYGLTMELFIEQSEYIETLSNTAGLRVALHSQWDMPFPEEEGVNVPPGQESDIGVVKVHVHRLEEPYGSKCSRGEEIRNYYSEVYGMAYSQEACKKSCGQAKIIKNCGCRMWEFPAPKGPEVPLCNISEMTVNHCVSLYEYKLSHDLLRCHCPLQCEEEIFELTLSSAQWPSAIYLDSFSRRLETRRGTLTQGAINLRDNVVKLVVYYQELNYELIEETPAMQLVDLISSIGGLVGLWIGVSVCTVAEFLELCLSIITFSVRQALYRENDSPPNPYTISDMALNSPELSHHTSTSNLTQTRSHDAAPLLWPPESEKHQRGLVFSPRMAHEFWTHECGSSLKVLVESLLPENKHLVLNLSTIFALIAEVPNLRAISNKDLDRVEFTSPSRMDIAVMDIGSEIVFESILKESQPMRQLGYDILPYDPMVSAQGALGTEYFLIDIVDKAREGGSSGQSKHLHAYDPFIVEKKGALGSKIRSIRRLTSNDPGSPVVQFKEIQQMYRNWLRFNRAQRIQRDAEQMMLILHNNNASAFWRVINEIGACQPDKQLNAASEKAWS